MGILTFTNGLTIEDEVTNSTQFTLDFYKKFFNPSENTIISPLSFRIIFSLAYQSAYPNSIGKKELEKVLHFSTDKQECFVSQNLTLNQLTGNPNLKILNKIYIQEGRPIVEKFKNRITDYHSDIEYVNYRSNKENVVKTINEWISNSTNGLIKDLISEKTIGLDTVMLLINTMYFKAQWVRPFAQETLTGSFYGLNGTTQKEFMTCTRRCNFTEIESLKSEILELPYKEETNFKFWIILPESDSNISEVLSLLTPGAFKEIQKNLKLFTYELEIPKFEIETPVDGKKVLQDMGINSVFENHELDILVGDPIKIDNTLQKAKIKVDTDGTEVAVSTC